MSETSEEKVMSVEEEEEPTEATGPPPLMRSSTFVVDEADDEDRRALPPMLRGSDDQKQQQLDFNGEDLLNGTMHAGGIKAILERVNKRFVFPEEVKSYISSHFRMIREENDFLRHSLEHKSRQLDDMATAHQDCHLQKKELEQSRQKLRQTETQLERERVKTKAMVRQLKEQTDDSGVVWMGKGGHNNNNNNNNNNEEVVTVIRNIPTPQPLYSSSDLGESMRDGKKGKSSNGKSHTVQNLRNEVKRLTELLHRELGSPSAVEAALQGQGWQGRDEQIRKLEDSLKSMQLQQRDSLEHRTPSGDSIKGGSSEASKQLKCQVAEVERDRLSEYVRVVTRRLTRSEELTSRAEAELREERRKTARLEHLLEKAQVGGSALGLSFTSSSSHNLQQRMANASDDVKALTQELEATKTELEVSRLMREEDWQTYLKMASENRKIIAEGKRRGQREEWK